MLTAVVLCKNEAHNLRTLVPSLVDVGSSVFFVDSGSTDQSVEIARASGATVLTNEWINYSDQFNWALSKIRPEVQWVLRIDADERLSPEMGAFLRALIQGKTFDSGITGYSFPLAIKFMDSLLRFGGLSAVHQLRLFRNGLGYCERLEMDEHISLVEGGVVRRPDRLEHLVSERFEKWLEKHIRYASREAIDCGRVTSGQDHGLPRTHPAFWRRYWKTKVYYRLPLFTRPILFWLYRYVLLGGFLDGRAGFVYHFFQCLWYRSTVDLLVYQDRQLVGREVRVSVAEADND